MKPLPMPLRLAAGLVATAIEEVQELPRKLVELPVTAVSQVLQASMRMQQRVTELAIKGDQALGSLRPVPETPTWARFDEDEMDPPFGGGSSSFGGGGGPFGGGVDHPFGGGLDRSYGGSNGVGGAHPDTDWNVPPPRSAPRTVSPIRIARDPEPEDSDEFGDLDFAEAKGPVTGTDTPPTEPAGGSSSAPAAKAPPSKSATEPATTSAAKASSTKAAPAKSAPAKPTSTTKGSTTKGSTTKGSTTKGSTTKGSTTKGSSTKGATTKSSSTEGTTPAPKPASCVNGAAAAPAASTTKSTAEQGPKGHEDYPTWTLPQLRGRFRSLELKDVRALLDWETSHLDRPPYVTMLSNRIASITGR